jgi:hypothetical protein
MIKEVEIVCPPGQQEDEAVLTHWHLPPSTSRKKN